MNHSLVNFYKKYEKIIFLIFSLVAGIFILSHVADYQVFLSQGDHGRDLYAFAQTLKGDVPYMDYWWVYGPLMPYYYCIFLKIFGITISSVLIGKITLILISTLFFYLTLYLFASPILAFLACGWLFLFSPDFYFTYNHLGAITVTFPLIYCICLFLKKQKPRYLYYALTCCLLLCFIKINLGIVALLGTLASVLLIDISVPHFPTFKKRKFFYFLALVVLPLLVFSIYFLLLHKLPIYAIRQCLPYLEGDHPYNSSIAASLFSLLVSIKKNIMKSPADFFFACIIVLSLGQTIILFLKNQTPRSLSKGLPEWITKRHILLLLSILSLFYILYLHEYLITGVFYRTFWPRPLTLLLMFSVITFGTSHLSKTIRTLLYVTLAMILLLTASTSLKMIRKTKNPLQFISLKRAKIYVTNPPDWIATVTSTVNFLNDHLSEEELFFALPYDPIYYYLTGKKSPTRQLIFFEHVKITEHQEKKIISQLEEKKVNWIVVSSRSRVDQRGLGRFGVTYCKILGEYIQKNYTIEAQFGNWTDKALWARHHGTRLLRRKKDKQPKDSIKRLGLLS